MDCCCKLATNHCVSPKKLIKLMLVVISCFAIWLILIKNLFRRYYDLQCWSRRNAVRKRYYSITAYYICTEYYSISVAPAVRIQNILTTVTVYDFCYFLYFQLSFYPPSHPSPPKDFGFAHISGVDLMTVGGGQLPPVAPPWRR